MALGMICLAGSRVVVVVGGWSPKMTHRGSPTRHGESIVPRGRVMKHSDRK